MSRRHGLSVVPPSALPVARPKTLADMVPLFLRWFQFVRMRSPNTVAAYGWDLRIFLEFAQKAKLELADDVRFQYIEFYLGYLRAERGSAVATANRHLHTLRAFWRYLVREGLATGNPAADVFVLPKEHRLPKYLTIPQQEQLLTVLEAVPGLAAQRDLALVTTGLFAGLRNSEFANLQLSHLDFEAKLLRVIQGKGRKDRELPIVPRLERVLRPYVEQTRPQLLGRPAGYIQAPEPGRAQALARRPVARGPDDPSAHDRPLPRRGRADSAGAVTAAGRVPVCVREHATGLPRPAPRATARRARDLPHHPARGSADRRPARQPAHAPPQLRHPPADERVRSPDRSGSDGAREHSDHHDVRAHGDAEAAGRAHQVLGVGDR